MIRNAIYPTSISLLLLFLVLFTAQIMADEPQPQDFRVLIDISGSMKKNDPQNLRIPAVNLLTELVPDGSKAGIWTFGKYVNMLVKHGEVDDKWRDTAKRKAKKISSVAMRTNIGAALEVASRDFTPGKSYSNTHFVLLTDGMVDISKKNSANYSERERILSRVVEKIAATGAKIHTIGLSENADMPFLQQLSANSAGIAGEADTPEDLTRVFAQAIDQAVPAEQVPIDDGKFAIDASVEEFTALIFHPPNSNATRVIEPGGDKYSALTKPPYVKWFRDSGYDLITISNPAEGEWEIDSDAMPGTRVTIVSNLKLALEKLKSTYYSGDALDISGYLTEDDTIITNAAFLKVIDVDLLIKNEKTGKEGKSRLSAAKNPPADGRYQKSLRQLVTPGRYEVSLRVDGKSFQRRQTQVVQLLAPFNVEVVGAEALGLEDKDQYLLKIKALDSSIDASATKVIAKLEAPDKTKHIDTIAFEKEKNAWITMLKPEKGDGKYRLSLKIRAMRDGEKFPFEPPEIDLAFPVSAAPVNALLTMPDPVVEKEEDLNEIVAPEKETPVAVETIDEPTRVEVLVQEDVDNAPESSMMQYLIIGGIAAASLLLLGLGIWLWKKRKSEAGDIAEPEKMEEALESEGVVDDATLGEEDDEALDNANISLEPLASGDAPAPTQEESEDDDSIPELEQGLGDVEDEEKQIEEDISGLFDDDESEQVQETVGDSLTEPKNTDENASEDEEEEFNLEDFDISETDELEKSDKT